MDEQGNKNLKADEQNQADDIGNSFLVERQLSAEYHSPAFQAVMEFESEDQEGPVEENGKPSTHAETVSTGQEKSQGQTGKIETGENQQGEFIGADPEMAEEVEGGGAQEPWFSPVDVFTGGVTGSLYRSIGKYGAKLLPSLGRAVGEGLLGVTADIPISIGTEKLAEAHPALAVPFNVMLGFGSAATVENAIMKGTRKVLSRKGQKVTQKAVKEATEQVKQNLQSGKSDEITDEVAGELNQKFSTKIDEYKQTQPAPAKTADKAGGEVTQTAQRYLDESEYEELDKYAINVNLDRIESEEDLKQIINKTANQFSEQIDVARRGTVSNKETEKLADDLGMTVEDVLNRRAGEAFNAEQALAARKILVSSADNLKQMAQKVTDPTQATDEVRVQFQRALALHQTIQAQVSGMTAEAGRALQSFNILSQSDKLKTRGIEELVRQQKMGNVDFDKIAGMVASMDDLKALNQFSRKATRATSTDMLYEIWINSLLSGPVTHAVNIMSNAMVSLYRIPEAYTQAGISKLRGGDVSMGEANARLFGLVSGFKDGLKAAGKTLWTGQPSDIMTKIEGQPLSGNITAEQVRQLPLVAKFSPQAFRDGTTSGKAANLLGHAVRLPGRGLFAGDELFKAVGYRQELNAQIYREVRKQGLEGDDATQFIKRAMNDPENVVPDIHMAAIDNARYQTFTKPLGEAGRGAQKLRQKIPGARLIVPFMRTPTNILKFAGERTPVAWVSKSVRDEIMAGGARTDAALAKMSLGSMVMATMAHYAGMEDEDGLPLVTGGGPSDPQLKSHMYNQGWQPYSFKIGGKYYHYGRLEPLGLMAGLAADYAEISGEIDNQKADEIATTIVSAIAKNTTSKTWLRGISELMQAFDDPDRYGERYIQQFAGTAIPTGAAQVERVLDPEMREVRGVMDQLRARTPGFSDDLPPRRNLWGEKIKLGNGHIAELVSPIYTSKVEPSPIDKELLELDNPIPMPKKEQHIQGAPIELKPEEYDFFLQRMNDIPLKSTGMNLKKSLDHMVQNSPRYKRQHPDIKKEMIRDKIQEAKALARKRLVQKYPQLEQVAEQFRLMQKQKMQQGAQ